MIGLTEHGARVRAPRLHRRGQARGYRSFRRRGMPFATAPREHVHGTWPMCRAVVAARLTVPDREWSVFRALQVAQFTTTLDLETPRASPPRWSASPGSTSTALLAAAAQPETEAAFAADRARGPHRRGRADRVPGQVGDDARRRASASPRRAWSSPATTAAGSRRAASSRSRPTTCSIANLDPHARRREPATDVAEVLAAFPDGVTTAEVAAVMAPSNTAPDLDAAEDALIALAASGGARRVARRPRRAVGVGRAGGGPAAALRRA